jgi:hypothetical protein
MPVDFRVKWTGSEEETADNIIVDWVYRRLKAGIPITTITYGKSRAGKSRYLLKLQDKLYAKYGIDFATLVETVVLIKPKDWGKKARAVFEEKTVETKNSKSLQMDEAKFLLNASDWQKLKNRTIRTIAATSGVIKPIWFIIIAQLLKDVDPKTRETADMIMEVKRSPGHKPSVTITIPYEKVYDLSTIKILPRAFNGNIIYPDGTNQHILPVFKPSMPRKEVEDAYNAFEKSDKTEQIFQLFDELDKETNKLVGDEVNKLAELSDYLVSHPEELQKIARIKSSAKRGDYYKFDKSARIRYDELSEKDFGALEDLLTKALRQKAKVEVDNLTEKELDTYGMAEAATSG